MEPTVLIYLVWNRIDAGPASHLDTPSTRNTAVTIVTPDCPGWN